MREFPVLVAAFSAGRLSYSKVRAEDARSRQAARFVTYRWDEDGSLVGSFRLAPEDAERFVQGLDVARGQLPDPVDEV